MKINRIQKFILRFIAKKLVVQSSYHKENIVEYYKIIIDESRKQFTEDSKPMINSFLRECNEKALEENE